MFAAIPRADPGVAAPDHPKIRGGQAGATIYFADGPASGLALASRSAAEAGREGHCGVLIDGLRVVCGVAGSF
jgi:hypothetical protein